MSALPSTGLATAAKKQHAAAQATLGEILWRGQDVRPRQARGLALIMLAHQNAVASGKEPQWIGDLYREALDKSDTATRKDAEAMLPELGNVQTANLMPTAKAKPTEVMVMPAAGATVKAAPPTTSAAGRYGAVELAWLRRRPPRSACPSAMARPARNPRRQAR